MGAADHRALPRGPPGRRARGLPARPRPARRRPRPRARAAAAGARAAGPRPRPGAPRRAAAPRTAGNLPSLAAELVGRDAEIAALAGLLDDAAARRGRRPRRHRQDRRSPSRPAARSAACRAASGSSGSRPRRRADEVLDAVIAALERDRRRGGAARAAPARRPRVLILDNCEHVARRGRGARRAPARRGARRCAILAHEPGRARRRRRGRLRARAARARRRRRAVHAPRRRGAGDAATRCTSCAARSTACRSRSSSPRRARGRCRSRRSPAASTTASPCCSDPTSRKPERRRALRATIGWSYDLLFPDDKRGLWALADVRRRRAAAGGRVRARGARRAAGGGDRRRRAARRPLARDRRRRRARAPLPAARQHPRVRARGDDGGGLTDRAPRRARRLVRRRGGGVDRRRAQRRARPSTSRSPGPSARTSTPRWPGARRTTRCARSTSPTASAGRGSSSATAAARSGSSPRSTPRATRRPARDRAAALLLAAWIEASTGHLEPARRHVAAADRARRRDRRRRPAGALRLLPRLRRLPPRRVGARAGADRPQPRALRPARPPVGPGRERAVRLARRDLGRRPARAPPRPATRSSAGSRVVDDPWLHVRRDAMLGELARVEHRFDDAVRHIGRAAETSGRLGFLQTEAYQVVEPRPGAVPGRRLRGGRGDARARRSRRPRRTGDVRLAALARVHLGRVLRALGRHARGARRRSRRRRRATATRAAASRPRSATACSRRSTPRTACRARRQRLGAILDAARRDGDAPVEVFALDALARLAADAGDAATARDLRRPPTGAWRPRRTSSRERDRTDARAVRQTA